MFTLQVKHCDACQRTRHANIQAPALRPIKTTDCWEIIGMDLVGPMAETSSGNKYICVFTDLFSKFVMARAIPSKEASSVARALTSVVLTYGAPKRIITDIGVDRLRACILYISASSFCAIQTKVYFFMVPVKCRSVPDAGDSTQHNSSIPPTGKWASGTHQSEH